MYNYKPFSLIGLRATTSHNVQPKARTSTCAEHLSQRTISIRIGNRIQTLHTRKSIVQAARSTIFVSNSDRRSEAKHELLQVLPPGGLRNSPKEVRAAISERVLILEHLCPTSTPAQANLDGRWEVLYCDTTTPGLLAARALLESPLPKDFAALDSLTLNIDGSEISAVAAVKLAGGLLARLCLISEFRFESDIRVRETYRKGTLTIPELGSDNMMDVAKEKTSGIPSVAQNVLMSALTSAGPLLKRVGQGVQVGLSGAYEREILISYLDEDLMVARSPSGTPEVLRRLPIAPIEEIEEIQDIASSFDEAYESELTL
mmetsp:Transcript_13471/g.18451  ORF Transcript_13471/g.18451 Transcript_13471/m.18451 type:complete len:317 (-) Transcript_13471:158-1108(-)|eukprot:CAMPEP_0196584700 /NCGR_PEP_ID=MMETSP1081-20130531/48117_1 /TAXON_ID=36882 /ORGANISM="Pyramimonas amylifera, Strain CCMP720" /LENGTH=316 /DNA_ID=CAMNT_0041906003 /DNA_START=78 /DNA_END=1028 /DNA_ORIENTATION=-